MTDERDELKHLLPDYLMHRNLPTNRKFRCLNPAHNDHSPSMSYDKNTERVHCFACGATYDIFDLIGLEIQSDSFTDQRDALRREFNIPTQNNAYNASDRSRGIVSPSTASNAPIGPSSCLQRESTSTSPSVDDEGKVKELTEAQRLLFRDDMQTWHSRVGETDYWTRRGITPETVDRFNLGYAPELFRGSGGVVIPTGDYSYNARNVDPAAEKNNRFHKPAGMPYCFFNLRTLHGERPVFITEGEIDALSIEELGHSAIAMGGAQNIPKLVRQIEEISPRCPLVLALDNDAPGETATHDLAEKLAASGIHCNRLDYSVLDSPVKDANEALLLHREQFAELLRIVGENAEKDAERLAAVKMENYSTEYGTGAYMGRFFSGIQSRKGAVTSTGFSQLDRQLDGGLYPGLYVIGAIPSLGKTTLILQIADMIADKGKDVLIFSYEMAKAELIAKSLSRQTAVYSREEAGDKYRKNGGGMQFAQTTRSILTGNLYTGTDGETARAIMDTAIYHYTEITGRHVFVQEGIAGGNRAEMDCDFIRAKVAEHIRITGNTPVVFVDYLQIIPASDSRASDKQNTDRTVTILKGICNDYSVPMVTVSSFNRENYRERVSMNAFKESGAIEYSSDVLLGLQLQAVADAKTKAERDKLDVNELKSMSPRKIQLVVLKNRNGKTGGTVSYDFFPAYNLFEELPSI